MKRMAQTVWQKSTRFRIGTRGTFWVPSLTIKSRGTERTTSRSRQNWFAAFKTSWASPSHQRSRVWRSLWFANLSMDSTMTWLPRVRMALVRQVHSLLAPHFVSILLSWSVKSCALLMCASSHLRLPMFTKSFASIRTSMWPTSRSQESLRATTSWWPHLANLQITWRNEAIQAN